MEAVRRYEKGGCEIQGRDNFGQGERELLFRDTGRAQGGGNTDSLSRELGEHRSMTAIQHAVVHRDNKRFGRNANVHEK